LAAVTVTGMNDQLGAYLGAEMIGTSCK
jgi:hypothetical protein